MTEFRCVATDAVVVDDDEILLLERNHEPYKGSWVLPGGMVERNETVREACRRETREEVGIEVDVESRVGVFDGVDRDPRGNVSIAYRCSPVNSGAEPREEARSVEWFDPCELSKDGLGFDHGRIVRDGMRTGI
ncbi:MAG: NUDIX domain-containing protein [Halobacteria archaeon]